MAEQAARAEVDRLKAEAARIAADTERETHMAADARRELDRLHHELARLQAEIAAAPSRGPELDKALAAAEDAQIGRAHV